MSRTLPLGQSEVASSGASGAAEPPEVVSEIALGHPGDGFHQALRSELVRRIGELSTYAETTCGPLTARDFAVTIVGFVLLPLFLVYLTWRMG